jgi:hypothetical protein
VKHAAALALLALLACASAASRPAGPDGLDAPAARRVLIRFAEALETGRFEVAWALLSPRWRALTTPSRLATDWRAAQALAREAAARARSRSPVAAVTLGPLDARLDLGEGREAVLVAEEGSWRVDALE